MIVRLSLSVVVLVGASACGSRSGVEATSLLGQPLERPTLDSSFRAKHEGLRDEAERRYREQADADSLIWVGRRTAYLGHYRDAIDVFTEGIERFPRDPRFLRHRGHRFITIRKFADATRDLRKAAGMIVGTADRIEPDGLPNARNQPRSSLHTNVWYHLGLAHYLRGEFLESVAAFERCRAAQNNDDNAVSSSYWLYLGLRRLGRTGDAARVLEVVRRELDVVENHAYERLLRFFAETAGDDAAASGAMLDRLSKGDGFAVGSTNYNTVSYGLGAWELVNGRPDAAARMFRRIIGDGRRGWAAFGYVAAEAEVARSDSGE